MRTELQAHSTDLERRVLELESLFEASQILNSSLRLSSVLDTLLLTAMGRFLLTRGMVALVRDGRLRVESVKGSELELRGRELGASCSLSGPILLDHEIDSASACLGILRRWGYAVVLPLASGRRELGVVAFGPKQAGGKFEQHEISFLEALVRIAATAVENALVVEELDESNRRLDRKLQEMNTLFELSTELNSSLDEKRIASALSYALMGEMLTNTCCVWLLDGQQARVLAAFGLGERTVETIAGQVADLLRTLRRPTVVQANGEGETEAKLREAGVEVFVPLWVQDGPCGAVTLGKRLDGRGYSEADLSFLQTLANHAANALENARLFRESLEKQRLEEELKIAREIQIRLLPREFPQLSGVDVWGIHKPSRWVAGDYYDTVLLSDDQLAFVIADVSGKGVPASLLMANVQASFRTLIANRVDLGELAARMNRLVHDNTDFDKFVTLFLGVLSLDTGQLRYVNAGHNPPYLLHSSGGDPETLEVGGLLMGMLPEVCYSVGEVQLVPGDLLYLFTDGVVEAQNREEEEFSEERLLELLRGSRQLGARQICEHVLEAVEKHAAGCDQYDDITMLALKFHGQ